MTWIKASERLPEGVVKCRWVNLMGEQIGDEFDGDISPIDDMLVSLEWLDESEGADMGIPITEK